MQVTQMTQIRHVQCSCVKLGGLWVVYTIQQTSSKLPANVSRIHVLMLDVCWTFARRLLLYRVGQK